ncbi:unnamed protein product [Nesidiocoris tenuis]|uniref:Uncharacterized protein n=1 Tax=Nesidiocoris tenuis TaxID=355587 RepID=A0A6H5GG46_9HEMI|nr:unnamed protein product [Nesidiocoris tenuis]
MKAAVFLLGKILFPAEFADSRKSPLEHSDEAKLYRKTAELIRFKEALVIREGADPEQKRGSTRQCPRTSKNNYPIMYEEDQGCSRRFEDNSRIFQSCSMIF